MVFKMDKEHLILEQYRIYSEQKENFVDRSFTTNKLYLALILILVLLMVIVHKVTLPFGITSTLLFEIIGMGICALWWINVDSYNFLIKIKLSKVIQEMEKELPVQPYSNEYEAINERRKNKHEFLFADIQKGIALIMFLLFFGLFLNEIVSACF